MPESTDLREFAESLFNAMIGSANMGITPPITFAVRENGQIHIETLSEKAAVLANIPAAKDEIFWFWRRHCASPSVDAFACGSESWGFQDNDIGAAYRRDHPKEHTKLCTQGFAPLLELGMGTRFELFGVVAQTRDRVLLMNRRFVKTGNGVIWTGEAEIHDTHQDKFKGRQKMWGDLRPENLR